MTTLFTPLAALGGVMLFLAAGGGLTELIPSLRKRPVAIRAGYAYLLGVAFVAGTLYVCSYLFSLGIRRGAILAIALLPVVAGLARRLGSRRQWPGPRPARPRWDPFLASAVLVGAVVSMGLFAEALTEPVTDSDGRMTWCLHARYIRAESSVNARVLRDPKWSLTNRQYPLLLPVAQVAVQEVFDPEGDDERVFRPLYAAFFPAFLLILYDGARRLAGRRSAAITTLVASAIPFLAYWKNGGADGTYSDFPLACFFGAGVLLLFERRSTVSPGIAAGLLLGAGVLTKREGLLLAVMAVLVGLACFVRLRLRRRGRENASPEVVARQSLPALLVLASAGLFLSWSHGMPGDAEQYAGKLGHASTYARIPSRLLEALPTILGQTLDWKKWGFFWVVAGLLFLAGRRALRGYLVPFMVLMAGPLAVACAAYGVHADPAWLARTTWNRFLVQGCLLSLVVFAVFLRAVLLPGRKPSAGRIGAGGSNDRSPGA